VPPAFRNCRAPTLAVAIPEVHVPKVDGQPSSTAALARAARAKTELELEDFAKLLGTPAGEVDAWEKGVSAPPPIGACLLKLILSNPEVCLHLLHAPSPAASGRHGA